MENRPKKKAYLIQLLVIFIILTIFATSFLIYTITDFGYNQFGRVVHETIKISSSSTRRSIISILERQKSWINNISISNQIRDIVLRYEEEGEFSKFLFTHQWLLFQEDQVKLYFGNKAELVYEILSQDSTVLFSTAREPGRVFSFQNINNQEKFQQFKNSMTYDSSLISFDSSSDNSFNLVIHLPFITENFKSIIAILIKNIDVNLIFQIDRIKVFPGIVYVLNSQKNIIIRYTREGGIENVSSSSFFEQKLQNIIRENLDNKDINLLRYKDSSGERVLGFGAWIDILDIGILFQIPSKLILGPWYYTGGLVVLVSIFSMLIFVFISVYLDQKRLSAYDHNPITHLPGNQIIVNKINLALKMKDMIIVYCDLDNFKAYNDCYGFSAGDSVISYSAKIFEKHLKHRKKIFLGHIGGDDFVVIGKKNDVIPQLEEFGKDFDEGIKKFYSQKDCSRGCIVSKDRQGKEMKFPFIAMSMGGLVLAEELDVHPLKVAELCAEVKKVAKKVKGSKLVIDRRRVN